MFYNANFTDKLVLNGGELIVDGEIGNGIPLIPGDQDHILVVFSGRAIARDIIFTSSSLQLGDYDFDSFKNSFIFLGSPFVNYANNRYFITNGLGKVKANVNGSGLYINGSSAPMASANSVNKTWQLFQTTPTANMDIGVTCHWTAGLKLAGFNDGACWVSQLPSRSYFIREIETGHIERFFKL